MIVKVKLREVKLSKSYEDYIRPAILWATEDPERLTKALDVAKVVAMGSFVSGLFGGERKSGNERYVGLVVSSIKSVDGGLYIRLFNMEKEYLVPSELMRRYGVDIYKVYYLGTINPFKCSSLDVVLSSLSEVELKNFIYELIKVNKEAMTETDERRLSRLAEKLKTRIRPLNSNSHYVIYRNNSLFSACVPEDLSNAVSNHHTAYLECKSAEQAHFYAAILNYIAHKTVKEGRAFMKHFYVRPLITLTMLGLTWRDIPVQLRDEIASLSSTLSKKLTWVDYRNQKEAILETAKVPEFKQIIDLLDKYIENTGKQKILGEALNFISEVL